MSSRMTIRVYRITPTGKRIPLARKRTVHADPYYFESRLYDQWPACACPQHAQRRPS